MKHFFKIGQVYLIMVPKDATDINLSYSGMLWYKRTMIPGSEPQTKFSYLPKWMYFDKKMIGRTDSMTEYQLLTNGLVTKSRLDCTFSAPFELTADHVTVVGRGTAREALVDSLLQLGADPTRDYVVVKDVDEWMKENPPFGGPYSNEKIATAAERRAVFHERTTLQSRLMEKVIAASEIISGSQTSDHCFVVIPST